MTKKPKPLLTAASIGKRYVKRNGELTGRLERCGTARYPYLDSYRGLSYDKFGSFLHGKTASADLIRLATPAEIAAGHALPVKERKAKEGRKYTLWCFEIHSVNRWLVTNETHSVTKRTATALRRGRVAMGSKCGPIFKITITCPAWNPK